MSKIALSNNRKVKFRPNHKNTFGLNFGLPKTGGTCPGATTGEGGCFELKKKDGKQLVCYVDKLTKIYPAVGNTLALNTELLREATQSEMESLLTELIEEFKSKNKPEFWFFRLHWSGDFFSAAYAKAWVVVVNKFPEVYFWVYTRSHGYVKYFQKCENITVYLSIDPVNVIEGLAVFDQFKKHPRIGLAWLGEGEIAGYKFVTCPETSGKLKNTEQQGACARCRLCVDNYVTKVKNIRFNLH